jgi:hypothetical protein
MACGCQNKTQPQAPRNAPVAFGVQAQDNPVAGPGEVLVKWKAPTLRHRYRFSAQRGRTYDVDWPVRHDCQ